MGECVQWCGVVWVMYAVGGGGAGGNILGQLMSDAGRVHSAPSAYLSLARQTRNISYNFSHSIKLNIKI